MAPSYAPATTLAPDVASNWDVSPSSRGLSLVLLAVRAAVARARVSGDLSDKALDLALEAQRRELEPLLDDMAWREACLYAQHHRVMPMLRAELDNWKGRYPSRLDATLNSYTVFNSARAVLIGRELLTIHELFANEEIGVVCFKGVTLAATAYPHIGMRSMGDLDVLVRRQDVARALGLLLQRGYEPETELSAAQLSAHMASDCVINLFHPKTLVALELHWSFTAEAVPFALGFDEIEAGSGRVRLLGSSVPAIGTEELLLILCVHGTKHVWERLSWVLDIALLLERAPAPDWERVMERAGDLGVARLVKCGLGIARHIFAIELPPRVERWIVGDARVAWMIDQSSKLLLRQDLIDALASEGPSLREPLPEIVDGDRFLLAALPGTRARIRFWMHLLTVPSADERALVELPERLSFLWCVIRPMHLVTRRLRR